MSVKSSLYALDQVLWQVSVNTISQSVAGLYMLLRHTTAETDLKNIILSENGLTQKIILYDSIEKKF